MDANEIDREDGEDGEDRQDRQDICIDVRRYSEKGDEEMESAEGGEIIDYYYKHTDRYICR